MVRFSIKIAIVASILVYALMPLTNYVIAVRALREELQLLQEPGSYVGEVVKVMGKSKVLVKVFFIIF